MQSSATDDDVRQPVGEKVQHVLRASATGHVGGHHCHWTGCKAKVPPAMWGCRKHWYALPKPIRDEIWRTFRPGQENAKNPSAAYVRAARAAQEWIASRGVR